MACISRRAFLAGFPALQIGRTSGKGQQFSGEARRYPDPLTDREVWRLTGLAHPHFLPPSHQRFAAQKNGFLLLAGRRAGDTQIYRLELPSGRMAQLSQGPDLAPFSICLAPDEKSLFFLQNGTLKHMGLRTLREREIHRVEDGWRATGEMSVSIDGRYAAVVVEDGKSLYRIVVVETLKGKNWVVAEDKVRLVRPQLRPKRDQVLYSQQEPARLWLVNLDGKQKQSVRPRQGDEEIGPEYWTGDGKLLGYSHYPDQTRRRATLRTFSPDTREEKTLAKCTQFWSAMGNADNSAIVGESRSKAGPNIYVLFPLIEREITVCEHLSSRSSEEVEPRPAFSPDSQWIYFTSDREGAPAVYRAGVGDWVEKT